MVNAFVTGIGFLSIFFFCSLVSAETFEQQFPKPDWWESVEPDQLEVKNNTELLQYWIKKETDHRRKSFKVAYRAIIDHPDDAVLIVQAIGIMCVCDPAYPHIVSLLEFGVENFFYFSSGGDYPGKEIASMIQKLSSYYLKQASYDKVVSLIERFILEREKEVTDQSLETLNLNYAIALHEIGDADKANKVLRAAIEKYNGEQEHALQYLLSKFSGEFSGEIDPKLLARPEVSEELKPAGNYSVLSLVGELKFAGANLLSIAGKRLIFSCVNRDRNLRVFSRTDYKGGVYSIYDLTPGHYNIRVSVDANSDQQFSSPGDLWASEQFTVTGGAAAKLDLNLIKVLHLTTPVDNDKLIPNWEIDCAANTSYSGPVEFSWDTFPEGEMYEYMIRRHSCLPYSDQMLVDMVIKEETKGSSVIVKLEPNGGNNYYWFSLKVLAGGKTIGELKTKGVHGTTMHGLNFRVR